MSKPRSRNTLYAIFEDFDATESAGLRGVMPAMPVAALATRDTRLLERLKA